MSQSPIFSNPSSPSTPRHGLPYISTYQAGKTYTHNEALARLDATHHACLTALDCVTPPGDPHDGDMVATASEPQGAFAGQGTALAVWENQSWRFQPLVTGMVAYHVPEDTLMVFTQSGWEAVGRDPESVPRLSINTVDAGPNLLSVKSPSVLFSSDPEQNGDMRLVLNRSGVSDTASLVLQSDFSARAELGLSGDDRFRLKVSGDGASFRTALSVDPVTGFVGCGVDPTEPLEVLAAADRVVRISLRNPSEHVAAGSAFTLAAGSASQTQLLHYAAGTAYFLSNASVFFYQLTGADPRHKFFAGSEEIMEIGPGRTEFRKPARLVNRTAASMIADGPGLAGDMVYVSGTVSGPAYSDGTSWRWVRDDSPVQS